MVGINSWTNSRVGGWDQKLDQVLDQMLGSQMSPTLYQTLDLILQPQSGYSIEAQNTELELLWASLDSLWDQCWIDTEF